MNAAGIAVVLHVLGASRIGEDHRWAVGQRELRGD